MSKLISLCRAASLALIGSICVSGAIAQTAAPKADDLLKQVRRGLVAAPDNDISGYMSKQRGAKTKFTMSMRGDLIAIQYELNGKWERFDLLFKESGLEIKTLQNGKMVKIADKDYAKSIADTDVSYEDLSMRFLYWKNGKVLPETAVVKGRTCWVLELKNPTPKVGNYAWVRAWVGVEDGALWQIDGYDQRGELYKKFILNSISKQKDGSWFFKEIKIEVRDRDNPKKVVSYSTINKTN